MLNLKGHLGNIRLTFTDKNNNGVVDVNNTAGNEILQENNYYPFGMDLSGPWMNDAALDNGYKYNGKELHTDFGLGWYAYGARWYDAQVGRFTGVDPIIEQFPWVNSYNYAENEPVANIDLHGLQKYKPKMLSIEKPSDLASSKMAVNLYEGVKTVGTELLYIAFTLVKMLPDQGNNVPVGKNEIDSNLPGKGNEMLTGNPELKQGGANPTLNVKGGADKIYTVEDLGFLATGGGVAGAAAKATIVSNAMDNLGQAVSRAVDAKKEYDATPKDIHIASKKLPFGGIDTVQSSNGKQYEIQKTRQTNKIEVTSARSLKPNN